MNDTVGAQPFKYTELKSDNVTDYVYPCNNNVDDEAIDDIEEDYDIVIEI